MGKLAFVLDYVLSCVELASNICLRCLLIGLCFPFSVARKYSTERVLGLFDLTSRKQAYRRGWLEPECEQHQQSNEVVFKIQEQISFNFDYSMFMYCFYVIIPAISIATCSLF
ncbi:hypothetical protein Hdeb2414_s0002g00065651 [Helianthus debilis subsp. tardiflorus]